MAQKKYSLKGMAVFFCFMLLQTVSAVDNTPFPASGQSAFNAPTNGGVFSAMNQQAQSVYSPFAPNATGNGSVFDPVLYGPGGEPIGGLPTGDANWILLSAVAAYSLYKLFKKRKQQTETNQATDNPDLQ